MVIAVNGRFRIAFFLLLSLSWQVQAETDPFQRGVEAYQSGFYVVALEYFQLARETDGATPAIWLNMGMSAFNLRKYGQAERYFSRLLADPQWQATGHYYLGRVAERENRRRVALRHYRDGLEASPDARLEQQLLGSIWRLETSTGQSANALLAFSAGYDSNPLLIPETSFGDTEGEGFAEVYGALSVQLPRRYWHAQGEFLIREYPDTGSLSDTIIQGGLVREQHLGAYGTRLGAQAGLFAFAGDQYQERYQLLAEVERNVGKRSGFRIGTELNWIDADREFKELHGWQSVTFLTWRSAFYDFYYSADYRFEWNDREDIDEGGVEESLSPIRQRTRLLLGWNITRNYWIETSAAYENSRYRGYNTFDDELVRRDDDRIDLQLRFGRSLGPSWQIYAQYGYGERVSTLDAFEFDRHTAQLSLVYQAW